MAVGDSAHLQDVFETVAAHMQKARSTAVEEEVRIKHLTEAKSLIMDKNPDLIDSFASEMLALSHEKSIGLVAFCLQWIRDSCIKEPMTLVESGQFVLKLMEHQSVAVQKHSLYAACQIYCRLLPFLTSQNVKEPDARTVWSELCRLRDHVIYAIQEDFDQSHVGFRLVAYKFLEMLVLCHSPRDAERAATEEDSFSSLDVTDRCKVFSRQTFEDEGKKFLQVLEGCITSPKHNIQYVDRLAVCGCLFDLAKRRMTLLPQVLTAAEFLHANVPDELSRVQVLALRKFMKSGLLWILRRTPCEEPDVMMRLVNLLLNLGTSNNELARSRPNLPEILKRKKREAEGEPTAKRQRTEDGRTDPGDLHVLATDLNANAVLPRLTPNKIIDLIMANAHKIPGQFPASFHAAYIPIGSGSSDTIVQHLARLMAVQMVAAGVGPGPQEVNRRRQEELSVKQQMEADSADFDEEDQTPQPISSLVRQNSNQPVIQKPIKDEEDENSMDSQDENRPVDLAQLGESFKPMEKALRVTECTEPIPVEDRDMAIVAIVNELIANDVNVLNAAGEFVFHKCLIRFAVRVGKPMLRERIMRYILEDIASRAELAFRWIYEEYAEARRMKRDTQGNINLVTYDDCLHKFVRGFIDHPEYREGLVSALYMEVPVVTDSAISLLSYYCIERSLHGAMRLINKLVSYRPNPERFLDLALHMTLHVRKDIQNQAVQTCIKLYETCPNLRQYIKDFATKTMKFLIAPTQPPANFFEYHAADQASRSKWTEDTQKLCTSLFIGLLADEPSLLPVLAEIYVEIPNEAKKVVFKVIEQPVKAVQMNDPAVLQFVRAPPKGSESLVLRIIHLLTESHPPSTELISSIRGLYNERIPDVRFLIPILNGLTKEEIFAALPKLITLNPVIVQEVFSRLLGTGKHKLDASQRKPSVTPAEVLIELHKIEMSKTEPKRLIKATGICLEEKDLYTTDVMIHIVQELVEVDPLPFLLMRTVLQTLQMHPRSLPYIIKILHRLVEKEVWNSHLLWEGFVKCCEKTLPQSLPVLLQLPADRLNNALESTPSLRTPLQNHYKSLPANQKAAVNRSVACLIETGKLEESRTSIVVEDEPIVPESQTNGGTEHDEETGFTIVVNEEQQQANGVAEARKSEERETVSDEQRMETDPNDHEDAGDQPIIRNGQQSSILNQKEDFRDGSPEL